MPDNNGVAHIVYPGQRLRDVIAGKKTKAKAMCGVFVSKRASIVADVCRNCFEEYEANGYNGGENGGKQ